MTNEPIEEADEFTSTRTANVPNRRSNAYNSAMQQHIVRCLANSGQAGATNRELVEYLKTNFDPDAYDSPVSGATSRMHREGIIVRLLKKRQGVRAVYVHPDHVPAGAETVQPRQQKEAQVFGLKTRNSDTRGEVEAAQAQAERDRTMALIAAQERDAALNALTSLQDELRSVKEANLALQQDLNEVGASTVTLAAQRDQSRADVERLEGENSTLRTSVGNLQTLLDRAEVENASVPQGPRKTFTADERTLVTGLAGLLRRKYPSDGTPDAPTRITLKVSTVRGVVNAAIRVVGD